MDLTNVVSTITLYQKLYHNPARLGSLVRRFIVGDTFPGKTSSGVIHFLDLLPNLTEIQCSWSHCKALHQLPTWQKIKVLRLIDVEHILDIEDSESDISDESDMEFDPFLDGTHFPSNLETLVVENSMYPLHTTKQWHMVDLPTVESIVFARCRLTKLAAESPAPARHRLLPNAPKLRYLSLADVSISAEMATTLINETAASLVKLEIRITGRQVHTSDFKLTPKLLSPCKLLEVFSYCGPQMGSMEKAELHDIFPSTLLHIGLTLCGGPRIAETFLSLLGEATFLPKLQSYPRLTLGYTEVIPGPSLSVVKMLLSSARSTVEILARTRLGHTQPVGLYHPGSDICDIPLLPYPEPYRSHLHTSVLRALESIEEKVD